MASKKNCILRVIACLGAVAVLCTVGAFFTASAEIFTFNNYSNNVFVRAYYQNSGTYGKNNYNFTSTLTDFDIPSANTNGYRWTLIDFSTTTTYSDESAGSNAVINGFIPGNSYDIILSINFAIKTPNGTLNTDYNWQAIKQYMLDNLYLGNSNVYVEYKNYSGPVYSGSYHYLLNTIENLEIKSSSLSVSESVSINSTTKYFPVSFTCSLFFTVPSDWTASDIPYIHLPLYFVRDYFTSTNYNTFYTSQLSRLVVTGQEYTNGDLPEESSEDTSDPGGGGSGETSDNGVSDIVEGQKEAVEHGQDLEQSKAQAALEDQNENIGDMQNVFNTRTLAQAFRNLYDGLAYDGTDFHFYFPGSGEVPYLEAELWERQEIPFKEAIDNVPSAILVIIRFLAWLGLAYFMFYLFKKILALFTGGSDK